MSLVPPFWSVGRAGSSDEREPFEACVGGWRFAYPPYACYACCGHVGQNLACRADKRSVIRRRQPPQCGSSKRHTLFAATNEPRAFVWRVGRAGSSDEGESFEACVGGWRFAYPPYACYACCPTAAPICEVKSERFQDEVPRVDGDKGRSKDEPPAQPNGPLIEALEGAAQLGVQKARRLISEEAFVDRINRSDRWMIIFTAVIAVSGLVSAVIFGEQLAAMQGQLEEMRLTRESGDKSTTNQLRIATYAANAAANANDIATQALITSQRPYVSHHQPSSGLSDRAIFFSPNGVKAEGIIIQPYWTNLGNTATHKLRVYVSQPRPITPPFDDKIKYDFTTSEGIQFTPLILGPRGDFILGDNSVLSMQAVADINSKQRWYYIFGWAEYEDGFRGTPIRRTRFCEIIREVFFDEKNMKQGVIANVVFCPVKYQCIDEQCDE